jgi:hypothetical protein
MNAAKLPFRYQFSGLVTVRGPDLLFDRQQAISKKI